uniref:WD repeat domain phosphoinositide-interacting protein 2 n=1 Tax=Ascaris lumbricoides TaxID=6252 RepID=A0A0M3HRS6_ASCLU
MCKLPFVEFRSLAVGRNSGYSLYSPRDAVNALTVILNDSVYEDVVIAEHLYSSALVLIVSRQSPRKLRVHNFEKGKEMGIYSYSNNILAVKLNLSLVVVCLEESIHVHNIRTMKELYTIKNMARNPHGLVTLSSADASFLIYPTSSTSGQVDVFDAVNLCVVQSITAHDSPLAAISLNSNGDLLATASNKGTVIRVFSLPSGDRLFEFCRGMTRCAKIHSLAFSLDSSYLCSSSNTQTVHIFKLPNVNVEKQYASEYSFRQNAASNGYTAWMDYFSRAATQYLPSQMSRILQRESSFATARLPVRSSFSAIALTNASGQLQLLIASLDGFLYCYSVSSSGGECRLVKRHDLRTALVRTSAASARRLSEDSSLHVNDFAEFPPI